MLGVAGNAHHMLPIGGKPKRDGATDSAAGSSDDGDTLFDVCLLAARRS
jgi:hypothetical protein